MKMVMAIPYWLGTLGAIDIHSLTYKSFKDDEIVKIKSVLEFLFSSQTIQHFSSQVRDVRFFEVKYRQNWILEGNGELYYLDDEGFRLVELNS
jgi:hypothetical protein